jgi:hypothetical protein
MPALASIVSTFLTQVKNGLSVGSDLNNPGGSTIRGAADNYLRAQDLASVLELLQDAMSQPIELTVTAGSTTTTIEDGASTFVPGSQVGNTVVFASDTTTTALQGVEAVVLANTDRQLTVAALAGTPVTGDTYTIRGTLLDDLISELRDGGGTGDAPAGNAFSDNRIAAQALMRLLARSGSTPATGTLTATGQPANDATVTIGSKVYTFKTTLVLGDGNVLIGGTASDSLDNLIAAINLGAGGGTTYSVAGSTLTCTANAADGDTLTIGSKVYTFQTVLTNVDGNVLIGLAATNTLDNLIDAINLGAGGGTDYAAATTLNADVTAAAGAADTVTFLAKVAGVAGNLVATATDATDWAFTGAFLAGATLLNTDVTAAAGASDTMVVTAKAAMGAAGNAVAVADNHANLSWGVGITTLTGGADGAFTAPTVSRPGLLTASGSTTTTVELETAGIPFRIDQFKGQYLTLTSEAPRKIVSSDESSVTVSHAYSVAPSASVAASIAIDLFPSTTVYAGGQPGDNLRLSNLIDVAQAAVVAFTLPT